MKDKVVYLVHGEIADYSDSDWWPVAAFTEKEKAEIYRTLLQTNPHNDDYTKNMSKYRIDEIRYVVDEIFLNPYKLKREK